MQRNPKNIKLPQQVVVKSPGLLPMLYKVRELSEELSVPEKTLRYWLEIGAPHQRDERGHVWINGMDFAEWIQTKAVRKQKEKRMEDDEAYCVHCKRVVKLWDPQIVPIRGKLIHIRGKCEYCGHTILRGGRLDQSN